MYTIHLQKELTHKVGSFFIFNRIDKNNFSYRIPYRNLTISFFGELSNDCPHILLILLVAYYVSSYNGVKIQKWFYGGGVLPYTT